MIYFTSDFHFNHSRIIDMERFHFKDIHKHDEKIISVLEGNLRAQDVLYFLGDLGWPQEDVLKRLKELPGKKYMILGNHDKKKVDREIFDEVYQYPVWISERIILSHEPVMVEPGILNIHGHLHGSNLDFNNYINANIHMCDYKLLDMRKISCMLSCIKRPNKKFLQEWYAGHQMYTQEAMDRHDELIFDNNGIVVGKRD